MEDIIVSNLNVPLCDMLLHLSSTFEKPQCEVLKILDNDGEWLNINKRPVRRKINLNKSRCQARVWNNGNGGRCSLPYTDGSEFCLKHCQIKFPTLCQGCVNYFKDNHYHDYVWQHLGRHDGPLPEFFKKK